MKQTHPHSNEIGQGLTEYIILMLLVSVVSIVAVTSLGKTVKSKIDEAERHISKVSGN